MESDYVSEPRAQLGDIYLTDEKVRQGTGERLLKSALLTEVNAAGMYYVDYPWLIALGVLFMVAGGVFTFADSKPNMIFLLLGAAIGIGFILGFVLSRQVAVVIRAGGMSMKVNIPGSREARFGPETLPLLTR